MVTWAAASGRVDTVPTTSERDDAPYLDPLTAREADVLRLVTAGLTNREIAARLGVSRRTIDAHLRSVFGKIGVASRSAATLYAVKHGLV